MEADIPIETQQFLKKGQTLLIVLAVFNGIMIYDFMICIPGELKHIYYPQIVALFKRRPKGCPARLQSVIALMLMLTPRLFVIPMAAISFTVSIGQPSNCLALNRTLLIMYAICVANSCVIFTFRTFALRMSEWPMKVFLWTLVLCISVIWIYWATQITIVQIVPTNPYQSVCLYQGGSIPDWTWVLFLIVAIFDLINLLLTLQAMSSWQFQRSEKKWNWNWKARTSHLFRSIYIDAIKYYVLSNAIIITLAAWNYKHRHDQYYTALVAPIHVWLNVSIAVKVLRKMKLYDMKRAKKHNDFNDSEGIIDTAEANNNSRTPGPTPTPTKNQLQLFNNGSPFDANDVESNSIQMESSSTNRDIHRSDDLDSERQPICSQCSKHESAQSYTSPA